MRTEKKHDPYLRHAKDYPVRPGLSLLDTVAMQGGPSLTRVFDSNVERKFKDYPKNPDEILVKGACVGLDENGLIRHMTPDLKSFAGFFESGYGDNQKGTVVIRGIAVLQIPDLAEGRGVRVFSTGPNDFNVKGEGLEIGTLLYLEGNNRAAVLFQGEADKQKAVIDWRSLGVSFSK